MISYDKYQNRIKRIAAVKNFIVRFRALFIALFALLVAASLALMFTKGIIVQSIVLPDKIVYGDYYSSEIQPPKAFLSNVTYQFKSVDERNNTKSTVKYAITDEETGEESEWTYELPSYAGKYLVRMVSNKIFGKSYSEPKEFEIETYATEFVITSDSIVYGEMPDSYTFNLVNGDRLIVEGLTFDYDNPANEITDICANADSFVILNSKGEDVTFCYNISVPKREEVSILPQDINLAPETLEVEYTGGQIDYGNTVYHLHGGDAQVKLRIYDSAGSIIEGNPVNAGIYTAEIIPEETKIFNGETDVTKHYIISYSSATIRVNKRPITVTTESRTKEYDGTPLKNTSVDADSLITGHICRAQFGEDMIDAGKYTNQCELSILDREGEDVTANYAITFNFGTFEIMQRKINVTTHNFDKVYDGTPYFELNEDSYSIERDNGETALVSGHTETVYSNYNESNVGTYGNVIYVGSILDSKGQDVTRNYNIKYEYGTLGILKREISVTTSSDIWIYDGYDHYNDDFTYTLLSDLGEDTDALAEGEEIFVIESTKVTYFTEEAVKNEIVCAIVNDYADVTFNYDIKYDEGTLKIEKRPIVITTPTISKAYDGTALFGTDLESKAENLAWCDRIGNVRKVASILNCGETENETHFSICDIYEGSLFDKTDNYEIEYVYGTLEVTVRDITISTLSLDKTYDGAPLMGDGSLEYYQSIYLENHVLVPSDVAQITDVGEIENTTRYSIARFEQSDPLDTGMDLVDVTDYFNISYYYGTLKVTVRNLWIVTADAAKEYDSTPLSCPEGKEYNAYPESNKPYGLVKNHTIVFDDSIEPASIIEAGSTPNVVFFKVFSDDKDVSENYEIWYLHGTLTITPRIIIVTTADDEWIYDGKPHSNGSATTAHGIILENGYCIPDEEKDFVLDHKLQLNYAIEVTNAGAHDNICYYEVVDENGVSVNYNYNLIAIYGTLTILPRPVKITTHDGDRVYDYTPFSHISAHAEEYDEENERGLIDGHYIEHDASQTTASVTFVTEGKVENELYYLIFGDSGEVTKNYKIEYAYGEIFVTKCPIRIGTLDSCKEFDGSAFSSSAYGFSDGLARGNFITAVSGPEVTYVTEGKIKNVVIFVINDANGEDLTENYEITYSYGEIWIEPRNVQVTTNSRSWMYDGKIHSDKGFTAVHLNYYDGMPDNEAAFVGPKHTLKVVGTPTEVKDYTESPVDNIVAYIVVDENIDPNYCLHMIYGKLSIEKRRISVKTATAEKVYDGDPFSKTDGWSVNGYDVEGNKLEFGLVSGHTLGLKLNEDGSPVLVTSITDVILENGEVVGVENKVLYDIFDGEENISYNYEIIYYIFGTLTRRPRPIIIYTDDADKVYDGTPLECDIYRWELSNEENTRGLLEIKGHIAILDKSMPTASITYIKSDTQGGNLLVSGIPNKRYYLIENGDGLDISYNYEISYEYGMLRILKRPLKITTATNSWDYDGQWHYDVVSATFDNLVTVDGVTEIWEVFEDRIAKIIDYIDGGIQNTTKYSIFTADGAIETRYCYDITYVYGTLTINRVNLEITTLSATKVYDGIWLHGNDESYGTPDFNGIIDGETHKSYNVTQILNVSTEKNYTRYRIYAERDGEEVETTDNYIISYIEGTLTIEKREITIKTKTISHEYDGKEFTYPDEWEDIGELRLVAGHTLEVVEIKGKITDVRRDGSSITGVPNEVIYKVVDGNGNDAVNDNYDIKYVYGELKITPRNILVTTKSNSWVYDSEEHSDDRYEKIVHVYEGRVEDGDPLVLIDTHALVPIEGTATVVVNYTAVKVTNEVKFVVRAGEIDVTGNYNISYTEDELAGKLEITKRPVTIKTSTKDSEYNGQPFSFAYFYYEPFDLAGNSGIVTSIHKAVQFGDEFATVTYVHEGEVDNIFTVKIVDKAGNDETEDGFVINDNYKIIYVYGKISITPHTITVTNPTLSKPYDGEVLYGNNVKIFDGKLFEGDVCFADKIAEIIDVGTVKNDTTYIILNAEGIDITDSYKIDYSGDATLEITAISLTITTVTGQKIYDGDPLKGDDKSYGTPQFNGKIDGESYKSYDVTEIIDVGSEKNYTQYRIFAERDGKEVETTDNYVIKYIEGTLTVTEREITVLTKTDSREYDGTQFIGTDGWEVTSELGLVKGHTLNALEYTSIIEVEYDDDDKVIGVENKVKYEVVDGNGSNEVNKNYIIYYSYGKLTINPRKITVTTATDSREYDGTPLSNKEDTSVSVGTLVDGHTLVMESGQDVPFATNVSDGAVTNEIKYLVYGNGVDVTKNYDIKYAYGTLTVVPRQLFILLNTVEGTTYGDEFSGYPDENGMYTYAEGSKQTIAGETLEITIKYLNNGIVITDTSRLNAGEYFVVIGSTEIVGGSIENYNVNGQEVKFTVSRRKITINLLEDGKGGKVYDGYRYQFDLEKGFKVADGTIVDGDKLVIAVRYLLDGTTESVPLNAGKYTVVFDNGNCTVNGDRKLALNYEITCNIKEVSYEITKRPLLFGLKNLTHEYTGVVFYEYDDEDAMTFDKSQLAKTDELVKVSATTMLNGEVYGAILVGEYDYVVYAFEVNRIDNGSDVTQNYYISENQTDAKLIITPRIIKLSVYFNDIASRDYTGEEINLIKEYPQYGPFTSEAVSEKLYSWGIYSDDLDKLDAKFSFVKNGDSVPLIDLGKYTVFVTLQDKEGYKVLYNYEIDSTVTAEFEITPRRINVTPKMTANRLEYNGEKLNASYLNYDTKHYFSDETGFLHDSDWNDYEATYSLYDYNNGGANIIDEILQAGTYYLKIKLKYIGTGKEQYLITEECDSIPFNVEQRTIYANTSDDTTEYIYNKTANTPLKEFFVYYFDGEWKANGFVNDDGKGAVPVYQYHKEGYFYDEAVDAGEYTIKIISFGGDNSEFIARNYYVLPDVGESGALAHGKLCIKPAIMVVVPVAYSEKYDGTKEILSMPKDNYTIKYVQGSVTNNLFGNDSLVFKASGTVNIRKGPVARITFTAVSVFEGERDVTSNYDIVYNYTQLKDKFPDKDNSPQEVKELTQADFGALLSFEQITLHVKQPQAPENYREVEYGTSVSINVANSVIPYENIINIDDLVEGHKVVISSARVIASEMGYVKQWVSVCKVFDSDNVSIAYAYNVILECEEDSWISVVKRELVIKVNLTADELQNVDELQSGDYTITKGSLVFGAVMQITVNNGVCSANILPRAGEGNYNDCYNVKFVYSEENNVKEAEYASRISSLLSRRAEIIKKDDISE